MHLPSRQSAYNLSPYGGLMDPDFLRAAMRARHSEQETSARPLGQRFQAAIGTVRSAVLRAVDRLRKP